MSVAIAMEAEIAVADDLPDGWIQTTMGDVADVIGGGTPKASDPSNFSKKGYAWITPADLSGYVRMYIGRGARDLSKKGLHSCSAKLMPRGAVLMSSRAPIGYVAVAENEVCTNQGFRSFVCAKGIAPEYVYYWLRFIRPVIEDMGSGSTFTEISGSKCKEIPLLLSPLTEQKRIVKKVEALLARVNAARERLANAPAILKRFRQTVLTAACSGRLTKDWRVLSGPSEEGELPSTWRSIDAGETYIDARYGTSMKCDRNQKGIPVLRVPNIAAGIINLSDLKYASFTKKELVSLAVRESDIVICRTNGSLELIGKAAVIPKLDREYTFASYLIRVRVDGAVLLPRYFHVFLSSPLGRDIIEELARSTAGQFNLNLEILRNLPIPLPPLEEQHEIVHRVEALFKLADAIEKRIATATIQADKLTQAILAKAFRGELVPNDAELARREGRGYETAAQLLHRIKSERAAITESKPPGAVSTAQ